MQQWTLKQAPLASSLKGMQRHNYLAGRQGHLLPEDSAMHITIPTEKMTQFKFHNIISKLCEWEYTEYYNIWQRLRKYRLKSNLPV